MNAETATQILTALDEALAKIKGIREAQEDLDDKMEVGQIEALIAQADGLALEALTWARRE